MPGAPRLGRLVPVSGRQTEAGRDLAEALAQLPDVLTHPEHLLFERREALRGQDPMGHEHAHEHRADDREDGDHHEREDQHEERTDRVSLMAANLAAGSPGGSNPADTSGSWYRPGPSRRGR